MELWTEVGKGVTKYLNTVGRGLMLSLIKKRSYLTQEDIASELTINLVEKIMEKPERDLPQKFFNVASKRELLNWIRYNNRQRRNEGFSTQYVEEGNDEDMPTDMFKIQSNEPTPEDIMIAKQLYEFGSDYFGDDFEVILNKVSREEKAKELSIPYSTYQKRLIRKIKNFKSEATEKGYL